MRNPFLSLLFPLLLAPWIRPGQEPARPIDFEHDLGVPFGDAQPIVAAIPEAARVLVARQVGCPPEELADVQLFRGTVRDRDGKAQPCDAVALQLAGPAQGGRVVFTAKDGCAQEMGLWGALDFDDDPTWRWGIFIEQLRSAGTHQTGAGVGAVALATEGSVETGQLLAELASASDPTASVSRALLRQRMTMRRNGIWLGMSRRNVRPPREWLTELASEMEDLAQHAADFESVVGSAGVAPYAERARDLAAVYAEIGAAQAADPRADTKQLGERMLATCSGCHGATNAGQKWPARAAARRAELDLAGTRLVVGFDIAPALGDQQGVSRELATKVKAGLLLLEAVRK